MKCFSRSKNAKLREDEPQDEPTLKGPLQRT